MNTAEFVEISYNKSLLYFTFSEFMAAVKRGKAFTRSKELKKRELSAHHRADRKRDSMLGCMAMGDWA